MERTRDDRGIVATVAITSLYPTGSQLDEAAIDALSAPFAGVRLNECQPETLGRKVAGGVNVARRGCDRTELERFSHEGARRFLEALLVQHASQSGADTSEEWLKSFAAKARESLTGNLGVDTAVRGGLEQ